MSQPFIINPKTHRVKIIQKEHSFSIAIQSILKDGKWSKNSLIKLEKVLTKNGVEKYFYRGLNLPDLLIIKQHWNTILKEMASIGPSFPEPAVLISE